MKVQNTVFKLNSDCIKLIEKNTGLSADKLRKLPLNKYGEVPVKSNTENRFSSFKNFLSELFKR